MRAGESRREMRAVEHTVHKRPYVGVSHARSWSPLLVLGAILWALIVEVDKLYLKLTLEIPPRRALRGIDSGFGEVPREQTMLKGHLPRVIFHQVY